MYSHERCSKVGLVLRSVPITVVAGRCRSGYLVDEVGIWYYLECARGGHRNRQLSCEPHDVGVSGGGVGGWMAMDVLIKMHYSRKPLDPASGYSPATITSHAADPMKPRLTRHTARHIQRRVSQHQVYLLLGFCLCLVCWGWVGIVCHQTPPPAAILPACSCPPAQRVLFETMQYPA